MLPTTHKNVLVKISQFFCSKSENTKSSWCSYNTVSLRNSNFWSHSPSCNKTFRQIQPSKLSEILSDLAFWTGHQFALYLHFEDIISSFSIFSSLTTFLLERAIREWDTSVIKYFYLYLYHLHSDNQTPNMITAVLLIQ